MNALTRRKRELLRDRRYNNGIKHRDTKRMCLCCNQDATHWWTIAEWPRGAR
jgi:hypothetical protein